MAFAPLLEKFLGSSCEDRQSFDGPLASGGRKLGEHASNEISIQYLLGVADPHSRRSEPDLGNSTVLRIALTSHIAIALQTANG